jgi:gas vesicle protein
MSYAGPSRAQPPHRSDRASVAAGRSSRAGAPASRAPFTTDSRDDTDWQQVAVFGVGLTLGLLLGAGGALLAAPRTGAETRAALGARAARLRRSTTRRGHDAWEELRDELHSARHALRRRKARRAMEHELADYEGE